MVTIQQIQNGFVRFVDAEVATAFNGWQKAIVAGTAGLIAANFQNIVKTYGGHPLVAALGVYDAKGECIDIDKMYDAYVPQMGADKIPVVVPKIGTIKIGKPEIDLLVRYIKES
jgi:hypothetical protein